MTTVSVVARRWRGFLLIVAMVGVAVVSAAVGANAAADRFGDVAGGHPHADGIGWVADVGVTAGCGDGSRYCPEASVSRAQMASFMHRLSGNAQGVAPSVDAATVQGLTPAELVGGSDTSGLEARLDALEGRIDELEADNAALQTAVADQRTEIDVLEALLDGVSRQDDALGRDTLVVSGMNLQVVNGTGTTDGVPTGVGNLIVGYDAPRSSGSDKTGSHYVVVGDQHNYTAHTGIVSGRQNTVSGAWSSVTGGSHNTASSWYAAVSGGFNNSATGMNTSISGGQSNVAHGWTATVAGGYANGAYGDSSVVVGGNATTITTGGIYGSILGGDGTTVASIFGCHPSCS